MPETGDPTPYGPTWELLNEEARHLIDYQRTAAERIEAKAALVVGAALTSAQFVSSREVESYWLPAANAMFFVAIAAGLLSVRPRQLDNVGLHQAIVGLWWTDRARAAAELANNRNQAVRQNTARHRGRVNWFWGSLVALGIGAIMSVAHVTWGETTDGERLNGTCVESGVADTFVCTSRP